MSHFVPLRFTETGSKNSLHDCEANSGTHSGFHGNRPVSTARLTDLSRGNDVLVFRVLVDSQTEDVVSVF